MNPVAMNTIQRLLDTTIVDPMSTIHLRHPDCGLCSREVELISLVGVVETRVNPRTGRPMYFPFYHLICRDCHTALGGIADHFDPDEIDLSNIPVWSMITEFIDHRRTRPHDICLLMDLTRIEDMLSEMSTHVHPWAEYNNDALFGYQSYQSDSDSETYTESNHDR